VSSKIANRKIVLLFLREKKASNRSGEETEPMLFDTSLRKRSTLHSRITSKRYLVKRGRMAISLFYSGISPVEPLLELLEVSSDHPSHLIAYAHRPGLFVYSMDYARTRLSVDSKNAARGGQRQFSGMIDV